MDLLAGAAATGTVCANTLAPPALAMMNPLLLMPNPKSLFDLWDEYLTGVGGESLQGSSLKLSEGGSSTNTPGGRLFGMLFESLSI